MKTIAALLASALLATFAHADTVTMLDGHTYTGDIVPDGKYFLSIRTDDGTTSVGVAQLAPADLARLDSSDRSRDGRFWFERCLALAQAYQGGHNVTEASVAAGPYVALGKAPAAPDPATLAVLKTLPLAAPLDEYQFESPFGVRVDPINGHRAVHTGIDLSSAYRSPVYSTQAGEIVFAGYNGAYGRMVEIDHGNGIHTRYGHLNRLLVSVGQHVRAHTEIGLLGSTGRSTGPHVHYEVLVDGAAQDPMRFLEAGRSVEKLDAAAQ